MQIKLEWIIEGRVMIWYAVLASLLIAGIKLGHLAMPYISQMLQR